MIKIDGEYYMKKMIQTIKTELRDIYQRYSFLSNHETMSSFEMKLLIQISIAISFLILSFANILQRHILCCPLL